MNPRFRTYPDSDDEYDQVIGYSQTGNVSEEQPAPPLKPIATMLRGAHASYILQMARESAGEFTVKELTARFGLAHQGAYFYKTLHNLIDAGLIERRIGKRNTAYLRSKQETI